MICQYDIFWIDLNPTIRHEIKKVSPCIVLSPDEMILNMDTIIIAPMNTKSRSYPTRVKVTFKQKSVYIVLDQIRTIEKIRLKEKAGHLQETGTIKVEEVLKEMLID